MPIGPWIADFACLKPRLAIEVDGSTHDWTDESDRTGYLESVGFTVLRFDNAEVAQDLNAVVNTITYWVKHLSETGRPPTG